MQIAIKFRKIQKQKNFALVARVSHVYVAIGGGQFLFEKKTLEIHMTGSKDMRNVINQREILLQ